MDFNAPKSLVDRADGVADLLDISRTRLLIDALEDELEALANDEEFRRQLSDAYYDGRIEYETVEAVVGREEAMRMKLLRASIDLAPPEPHLEDSLPSDEVFYDGDIPDWTAPSSADSSDTESQS